MSRNIVFISTTRFPYRRNSARFQRLKYLGENYRVYFFGKGIVCRELERKLAQKRIFRWPILRSVFPFWIGAQVLALSRRIHIDAVYTTFDALSLLAGFLLEKAGFMWIADLWDDPEKAVLTGQDYQGLGAKLRLGWRKLSFSLARKTVREASLVITLMKPEVMRKYHVDESKILPITNGVDISIAYPPPSSHPEAPFTIGYVGFVMRTRLKMLTEAAKLLSQTLQDFRLLLVGPLGESQDREWLRQISSNSGLRDRIMTTGELEHEQVLQALSEVDVCVCPYPNIQDLNPAYPIKVFEYMAMGKPVVATRLRGISEIIEHSKNGLLVAPDSPTEMADAILELYHNESLRQQLGKSALERVRAFEWSAINARIGAAIDDLLESVNRT